MKKFGRGFSLDFEALMNEVRQPPSSQPPQQGDEGSHRTPGLDSSSTEAGPSTTTKTYARFNSYGSEDAISPVDPSTPPIITDDGGGSLDRGGGRIGSGGTQTRMSVSRTGRCKNRNRQRLSVLQDEDFYRVGPSSSSSSDVAGKAGNAPPSSSSASTVASPKAASVAASTASAAAAAEAIDFDSVLNALDKSIQAPASSVMADCYSF